MKLGKIFGFVTLLTVFAIIGVGIVNSQSILDWYKIRGYEPTQEIVSLADNTTMLDSSRRLFYVNRPVVADKDLFNQYCREDEYSIVLGCYLSGQNGIYLLDVNDERLSGIKEVTAAHELLHAAYERLGSKEKQEVDSMLAEAFKSVDNTRILDSVEQYRQKDPSIVPNELHSILGSEVRDLSPKLEEYYAKYFSNRLDIVSYSEKYEQAFIERENSVRQYDIELKELKTEIDSSSSRLNQESTDLTNLRTKLNQLKNDDDIDEYNALVPEFNSKVNTYNQDVDDLSAKIVKYNELVQARNNIVSEEAELIEAIDSRKVVPDQR